MLQGKTNTRSVLAQTLAAVADGGDSYMPVTQYVINPKSITQGSQLQCSKSGAHYQAVFLSGEFGEACIYNLVWFKSQRSGLGFPNTSKHCFQGIAIVWVYFQIDSTCSNMFDNCFPSDKTIKQLSETIEQLINTFGSHWLIMRITC